MATGTDRGERPWKASSMSRGLASPRIDDRSSGVALPGRLVRAAAGALLAFLLANVVVAVAVSYSPGRRVDPVLGNVHRPGLFVDSSEGYCATRLNSMGLRAPEPSDARRFPERLLFLGDSITEAYQVLDEETFVLRVEEGLSGQGRQAVCVNAGVSGAGPADYIYLAATMRTAYAPTQVVVQLGDADFGPSLTSTQSVRWLEPQGSGWTVRRAEAQSVTGWLREVGPRLPAAYYIYQRMVKDAALRAPDASQTQSAGAGRAPDPRIVEWVVTRLREEYGSNVLVLYIPQIDWFGDTMTPTATETLAQRICGRLGVGFVDVRGALSERYARTRQPLNGFANTVPGAGHWNAEGHEVIAAELVRSLILTPGSLSGSPLGGD